MELGELPAGWAVACLDDLLTKVSNGANVVQYEDKNGYPISRIETIWNESIDLGRVRYIRESDTEFIEKYALQYGDILFSHINSDAHLGKTALFKCQVPILIHGINLLLLRPEQGVSPDFLNYQFKYLRFKGSFIDAAQRAVNQSSINQKKLKSLEFVVPPTTEQHRIVVKIEELFSELDQGVASLKTAREQLKVYRQSLLKNAFEGKLTAAWRAAYGDQLETATALQQRIARERQARYQQQLANWQTAGQQGPKPKTPKPLPPLTAEELAEFPELPAGWGWVKLGELTWSVKDGPHFSPKYSESGVPFISGGNVRPEGIDFTKAKFISPELHKELSKRCKPDRGDLLYTKGGTTGIARVNTYDVDFNVWVHVAVLKLTEAVSPFYVQHALNSSFCYSQAQKYTHGVGNQDLGLTRMVNIVLAVCSLSEQEEVIKIVDDKMSVIDQLDQTLATALQQADALRQSILKKAFHGQLVKQAKNEEPATALLERIRAARLSASGTKKTLSTAGATR